MKRLDSLVTEYNDVDVWETRDGGIDFDVIRQLIGKGFIDLSGGCYRIAIGAEI